MRLWRSGPLGLVPDLLPSERLRTTVNDSKTKKQYYEIVRGRSVDGVLSRWRGGGGGSDRVGGGNRGAATARRVLLFILFVCLPRTRSVPHWRVVSLAAAAAQATTTVSYQRSTP